MPKRKRGPCAKFSRGFAQKHDVDGHYVKAPNVMKRYVYSVLFFCAYALVGPAIASFFAWTSFPMSNFMYDLVGQIWPFWLFSLYESVIGLFNAMSLGAAWNIALFAVMGLFAGGVSRSRVGLTLFFAVTCIGQVWWFWFGMGGFPARITPYLALAAALVLFTVPFVLVARIRD